MSKTHGGLIASIPGVNLINFLFAPIYLCVRKRSALRKLTGMLSIMNYMFILIPTTLVFIALNASLIPFAYLRTLLNKIMMCRNKGGCSPLNALTWLLIGMPILISYQLFDLIDFVRWSTVMDLPKSAASQKNVISKHNFSLFYKVISIVA